jgi:hypothetical protein
LEINKEMFGWLAKRSEVIASIRLAHLVPPTASEIVYVELWPGLKRYLSARRLSKGGLLSSEPSAY